MFYLYVKTHNRTGLKYLGKTEQDPYTYLGSGKYWIRHYKKHGKDITTQILLMTESKNELKETGVFFSKLWNIVKSNEWANCKPEEGDADGILFMVKIMDFSIKNIQKKPKAKYQQN